MEGFLSNNVRDFIAVAGLVLAVAGFVATLISLRGGENHGLKKKGEAWSGRNSNKSLYGVIEGYFESPARDFRLALYIAFVSLLLTILSSWAIFHTSEQFKNWSIIFSIVAALVELASFFYAFVEFDHWFENNFESSKQRKLWRFLVLTVWIVVLLLCVLFVKFVQPPGGWFLGFVGLHAYGFLLVSFFGLVGYLGERYG